MKYYFNSGNKILRIFTIPTIKSTLLGLYNVQDPILLNICL